jgi:hypothetical protein
MSLEKTEIKDYGTTNTSKRSEKYQKREDNNKKIKRA